MEFANPEEQAWYDKQCPIVQQLIRQLPPWGKYYLESERNEPGDWYTIDAYCEDGTVSVVFYAGQTGFRAFPTGPTTEEEWRWKQRGEPLWLVFGVAPEDLTPITSGEERQH
jgi:hypothetical protein